eukprot:scaffold4212_cov122-Isochrysis_galbana.AAC.16
MKDEGEIRCLHKRWVSHKREWGVVGSYPHASSHKKMRTENRAKKSGHSGSQWPPRCTMYTIGAGWEPQMDGGACDAAT